MSERNAFLKALAKNEDDITTRLVYADWLDERGEYDEADRQRMWPQAKEWLVKFCKGCISSYPEVLRLTQEAMEEPDANERILIHCGEDMVLCDELRDNAGEFWKNWSIVTGIPLPPDIENKSSFSCAC